MSPDDGYDESSFLCLQQFFFLSRFFFFNDESDNDASESGSFGMCPFTFSSGNSLVRASGGGSEMVKCFFPFYDVEMVKFFFKPIGVESKVGRLIEIFSRSRY